MSSDARVERLLERWIEHHVVRGERLDVERLCRDCPELAGSLREHIRRYERLDETLDGEARPAGAGELPSFAGFRTVERIGSGGGGEVYKLEDLELGRAVAAKIVRPDNPLRASLDDFLREARSLALFEDPRIVRVLEFRGQADPPVLLMEHVDGFELDRIGRSLDYAQRARLLLEIAEAIHYAHGLGIQHRDLKPANILVNARLQPKILDFGLSRADPGVGHGVGTPAYMAPEQLDAARAIDARTDVYALGVLLYELLCGEQPYRGSSTEELLREIRFGAPRLPAEVEPGVPEPLQAIALKAMEREPGDRYASARDLALDLRRFLEGSPVLARPTVYHTALERRVRPHLEQIREWSRMKLIYPHEAEHLGEVYGRLELREDEWLVHSRSLSFSQIALYLGALLLVAGSLLYSYAYFLDAVEGVAAPLAVLGLPCVGLSLAGRRLHRRERQAVAVAFHLAAVLLLPLLVLILLDATALWAADPDSGRELLGAGLPSNRQLQLAGLVACAWAGWLALSTRSLTLGVACTSLLVLFHLAVLGDFGLRPWLEQGEWHRLALHLLPLLALVAALAPALEARGRPWMARPLYVAGAALLVAVLELLALNGKAFEYLGLSMAPFQHAGVTSPKLLDTLTAMTLDGIAIYAAAWLLERHGTALMRATAWLLYVISPFAILHPLSYLSAVGEYSKRYDWLYLALALAITFLSHYRQRRSFYYAGMLNTAWALWLLTGHHEWFERPAWAVFVATVGVAVLLAGFSLHDRERRRRVG